MLNSVILMGRLTADPELRTTTTGKSVCSFSIAVDRGYVKSGEERKADFINIVAWENQANFVTRYFNKGSMIAISGRLETRSYEDKNGQRRTAYEVIAREVSFCGSKADSSANGGSYSAPAAPAQAPAYQTAVPGDFEEITDDEDLPF